MQKPEITLTPVKNGDDQEHDKGHRREQIPGAKDGGANGEVGGNEGCAGGGEEALGRESRHDDVIDSAVGNAKEKKKRQKEEQVPIRDVLC